MDVRLGTGRWWESHRWILQKVAWGKCCLGRLTMQRVGSRDDHAGRRSRVRGLQEADAKGPAGGPA